MHVLPQQLHAQRCTCTCRLSECVSLCRVSAARDNYAQPLAIELMIVSVKEGKKHREKRKTKKKQETASAPGGQQRTKQMIKARQRDRSGEVKHKECIVNAPISAKKQE